MSKIDTLTELFRQFPGIGPRQARRFVYYLLRHNGSYRNDLAQLITSIGDEVQQCTRCFRYARTVEDTCSICADSARSDAELMVVEKDTDVEAMEKSGTYSGKYFVLGGTLKLTQTKKQYIREKELFSHLKDGAVTEVVLALSATPDGEHTTDYLRTKLPETLIITTLGRGLSTGSELEYADADTLRSALKNRA